MEIRTPNCRNLDFLGIKKVKKYTRITYYV
jgi:hypothetical protein